MRTKRASQIAERLRVNWNELLAWLIYQPTVEEEPAYPIVEVSRNLFRVFRVDLEASYRELTCG